MSKRHDSKPTSAATLLESWEPLRFFPEEYLSRPMGERLKYFKDKMLAHKHLTDATNQVLHAIKYPTPSRVVFVYAPSGAGKTQLIKKLIEMLIEEALADMERDPDFIPAAYHEIRGYPRGRLDWPGEVEGIMLDLRQPPGLIDNVVYFPTQDERKLAKASDNITQTVAMRKMRRALERCISFRRPNTVILEEAQHLTNASARDLPYQLDIVKSLANVTQTVFVLVGTYDLLQLSASAELSRRGKDIHFQRYHKRVESERHEFKNVIHTMQGHLPLQVTPDLITSIDFVHERSLGCVGTLKDWMYSALALSLEDEERKPFEYYLEETRMPDGKVIASLQEIHEGERAWQLHMQRRGEVQRLTEKDSGYERIEEESAVSDSEGGTQGAGAIHSAGVSGKGNGKGSSKPEKGSLKTSSAKTKPGIRKPARDKVGIELDAS